MGATNDSDSKEEDVGVADYLPLSQFPTDADPASQTFNNVQPVKSNQAAGRSIDAETLEVCSSPCKSTNIDWDAEKIDQVKTAMTSFDLPSTAIPEWANSIVKDHWTEKLIDRIKEMQNK